VCVCVCVCVNRKKERVSGIGNHYVKVESELGAPLNMES